MPRGAALPRPAAEQVAQVSLAGMLWFWVGFLLFVFALLAFDLGVASRRSTVPTIGKALAWTGFYVALALLFNLLVYAMYEHHWLGAGGGPGPALAGGAGAGSAGLPGGEAAGPGGTPRIDGKQAALEFFMAWLLEKSLSLDNIFVIALIFSYFRIPTEHQHRVLFWGILGALLLRGLLIGFGAALMARFSWMIYVFGGLLLLTAVKMLVAQSDKLEPESNPLVRIARRIHPVTTTLHGSHFFVREGGVRAMTPLFLTLLVVESTDVLFALDSIPAVFAVTSDPFLVFTSNIFAILGLRALYFVLAGFLEKFRYMKMSLVFVLAYVGVKMMLSHSHPIPNLVSLAIIGGLLAVGVAASVAASHRETARLISPIADELEELGLVTLRQGRRVVIFVIGSTLLALGVLMLVTPGPGLPAMLLGLGLLGLEFAWARRWMKTTRRKALEIENVVRRRTGLKERVPGTDLAPEDPAAAAGRPSEHATHAGHPGPGQRPRGPSAHSASEPGEG